MPATIQPERILKELAELWVSLAQPGQGEATASGVLRACSMTLLVAAKDERDAQDIGETVGALMHEHPSRAIVLKPDGEGSDLNARVYAQCWMPFGGRQQICCEQIEIVTPEGQLDAVSRVILGLLAPDLPAVLWARGGHWFERAGFEMLYPLFDKIVLDSCTFENPEAALAVMRKLRGRRRPRVGDLSWARLTMWREMIAYTLEVVAPGEKQKAIRSLAVEHYEETPSISCYYLAAWLARALPSAVVTFRRVPGELGRVAGVELTGDGMELAFRRVEGETVQISGAQSNVVVLPHSDDYRAMREELAITGADPVLDAVFAKAEELRAAPRPA
jgi:glucose-6-phosphate dehydrogenase assembly protein OpcA